MGEKIILVTGAAHGLGKAISKFLTSRGHRVIGTDIDAEALIGLNKDNIQTVILDTTSLSSIQKAYEEISKMVEGIDVLVNNAGIFDQIPLVEGNMKRYEHLLNVNVMGAFRVTRVFFPLLLKKKGRIINISSETAKTLLPFQTYGLTKYMMEAWSNTLRMELKLLEMDVVLIRPGGHKTNLLHKTIEILNEVPQDSLFKDALHVVKTTGVKKVMAVNKNPNDVARVVYKAIQDKRPRRIYRISESNIYRFLAVVPRSLKEKLVLYGLRK